MRAVDGAAMGCEASAKRASAIVIGRSELSGVLLSIVCVVIVVSLLCAGRWLASVRTPKPRRNRGIVARDAVGSERLVIGVVGDRPRAALALALVRVGAADRAARARGDDADTAVGARVLTRCVANGPKKRAHSLSFDPVLV